MSEQSHGGGESWLSALTGVHLKDVLEDTRDFYGGMIPGADSKYKKNGKAAGDAKHHAPAGAGHGAGHGH